MALTNRRTRTAQTARLVRLCGYVNRSFRFSDDWQPWNRADEILKFDAKFWRAYDFFFFFVYSLSYTKLNGIQLFYFKTLNLSFSSGLNNFLRMAEYSGIRTGKLKFKGQKDVKWVYIIKTCFDTLHILTNQIFKH
jgi:hypothetical protein